MKTVKMVVSPHIYISTAYSDYSLSWGFCSTIDKNRQVILRTGFGYCREGLTGIIFQHINGYKTQNIYLRKTRLAARIVINLKRSAKQCEAEKERYADHMNTGLNLVNILEKRHGWPLTEMYEVTHRYSERLLIRMFVGTNKWMRSPAMLSMFTLLIRIGSIKYFNGVKDYTELMKAAAKCKNFELSDNIYVTNSYKYWDILVGEFDRIFRGITYKEAYKYDNYIGNSRISEGINKICSGGHHKGTSFEKLDRRFKKIVKEYGIK